MVGIFDTSIEVFQQTNLFSLDRGQYTQYKSPTRGGQHQGGFGGLQQGGQPTHHLFHRLIFTI